MSVEVILEGSTLTVAGEKVRKGWSFTRKGGRKYHTLYFVNRWGRNTVGVSINGDRQIEAKAREALISAGVYNVGSYGMYDITMTREQFAEFIRDQYGDTAEAGTRAINARVSVERVEAEKERGRYERDEAHEEAVALVEQFTSILGDKAYSILNLVISEKNKSYAEGYEAGEQAEIQAQNDREYDDFYSR